MIIHWPAGLTNPGRWERNPGHLIDIMATCLELGQGIYPKNDRVQPLQGKSLVPYMHEQPREGHEELYFIFNNCRALRQGDWKLVSFYGQQWELYDLGKDRFEQRNVAEEYPDRVSSMADRWYELAEHTDFQPPKRLLPVKEGPLKYDHREWHRPELTEMWRPYE
jgi:arylsulfatase A-like enzyme